MTSWYYFSVWARDNINGNWGPWRQLPGIGPQVMADSQARYQHTQMMGVNYTSSNVITQTSIGRYRWNGQQWAFEGWL